MKHKHFHALLSCLLAVVMVIGIFPALTAQAAQQGDYRDPAEHWLTTGNRTGELDINANITDEIMMCLVCNQRTLFKIYRVPEYTRSGGTALNRNVLFSDGTMMDGVSRGNADAGVPGANATYTGYHYTKNVCTICGTLNANMGDTYYGFNNNVYNLYDCAAGFMVDLHETHIEPYNHRYHTEIAKNGQYCQFCFGTYANTTSRQVSHSTEEQVDAELGNQRFRITGDCGDCNYHTDELLAAKTVITSYYGMADGKPHTLILSDLSDEGVNTSIRYGNSAGNCNLTSAPNYVDPGFYTVYYATTYSYGGESMTENGVAYVQLYEAAPTSPPNGGNLAVSAEHSHDFHYLDTISPSCGNLGWENWQCRGCGALEKRNYKNALGHDYRSVIIREASCTQNGRTLLMCNKCGDFYEETTPMTTHNYTAKVVPATCTAVGYTEHKCATCGIYYVTDITQYAPHHYHADVIHPTCTEKGYTQNTCEVCDISYTDNYTNPAGHKWDGGEVLTSSTCESEGVKIFTCLVCDETMLQAVNANGHRAGAAATCTEPQSCLDCFAILALPLGHEYDAEIIPPTCSAMGYTIFSCTRGDDSYVGDYTDRLPHDYIGTITAPTCETMGYTTYGCADCEDSYISNYTEVLAHNYMAAVTVPTCLAMGYTVYTCADCNATYTGDYTDPLGHDYELAHTLATCTAMGFTTYTCKQDDNSYIGDYIDALGHTPSEWIIDEPATLEAAGSKHIECLVCGEILSTVILKQLKAEDYTDNNGMASVGGYVVIVTDKDTAPVPHAGVLIDIEDNIGVELPDGRLLDYADQTTVTVLYAETEELLDNLSRSVPGLTVTVSDLNSNYAMGVTNEAGQITVPTSETDTGNNGNGTIGGGDGNTYVVTVTDKNGDVIDDCVISIDKDGKIGVLLPEGTPFDRDNPVTVTVTDQNGKPQKDIPITIGDEDGITNALGKVTLPPTDRGYTNEDGVVKVNGYIVIVENTEKTIARAFVTNIENNKITVLLPEPYILTADKQTTVTVLLADKETPVKGLSVTVFDYQNRNAAKTTNADGKITVPDKQSTGGGSGGSGGSGGGGGGGYIAPTPTPVTHTAYVLGYPGGDFRPENSMTRAEAAAIFARLLADKNGDTIRARYSFPDISEAEWYAGYVAYLKNYGIIMGYPDGTFGADNTITRAEFTAMSVRFYETYTGKTPGKTSGKLLKDVQSSYWATSYIQTAIANSWIVGYPDGTFKGEADITRAEVVTVVNRVLGRKADKSYIDKNLSLLTQFKDVSTRHWAYYDIMEAANTHDIKRNTTPEAWQK